MVFTGDRGTAMDLDTHDTFETAVRTARDCLLVLADYLRARDEGLHDAGVTHYLQRPPDGFWRMSPKRHAPTETAATIQRLGQHRVFPVPRGVSASKLAELTSQFKLARIGMVSLRLYYLDNYASDLKVYVG